MIPHLSMLCKFIISTTNCSKSHPPSWYHPTFSITELHPSINGLFSSSSEDQDWIWGADGLFNIGNTYSTFLYFSVFHIIHISLLPLTSLLTIRNIHHLQVLSKWNCRTRMFWQIKASSQFIRSILKTVLKCAKPSISSLRSPQPPPHPLLSRFPSCWAPGRGDISPIFLSAPAAHLHLNIQILLCSSYQFPLSGKTDRAPHSNSDERIQIFSKLELELQLQLETKRKMRGKDVFLLKFFAFDIEFDFDIDF